MQGARSKGPRRLARRLATIYVVICLAVLGGLSFAVYAATALYLERTVGDELAAQAEFYAAYAETLAREETDLSAVAHHVVTLAAPQSGLTLRIFSASSGRLLASTQEIGTEPSQVALSELGYRSPGVFTQSARDLANRRYAASTIRGQDSPIGVIEVSRSTLPARTFLASLRIILLAAIAVGGVAFGVASIALARRIAGPIVDMEAATGRIAAGDYSVQVNARSSDEIGRLADSINDLASRLQELEGARMRFISEVSHDLRTPLAAVKGLLANLVDDATPLERPDLELAERETDRLTQLVNQLLDFARWQGGRLAIERRPVDVCAIARDAAALCAATADHRSVGLSVDLPADPLVLDGDGDRLQRVLLNLLDNAIKFTPAGGRVVVSVAPLDSQVEVAVADTGRGMSHDELTEAFEPYRRGEGGGTGLGLAISHAIVEAHGGQMDLESVPSLGSRVRFTLPR